MEALAATIRATDRRELQATSGSTPLDALTRCVAASDHVWAGEIGGQLAFIGGASPADLGGKRRPWLIGSHVLDMNPATFLRYCKEKMPEVRAAYPWLENYVDARATTTVRWLKWLGFTIEDPAPYGILQRPFHRFWMKAPDV